MSEKRRLGLAAKIAIGAAVVLGAAVMVPVTALVSGHYRIFYIPSETMLPTLRVNERIVVRMERPEELRRGMIVLIAVGRHIYVKRIAALPGDRIAMRGGVVILNGRPVAQRRIGEDRVDAPQYGNRAIRLAERFPGEARPHQIYDLGRSLYDDTEEQRVAPGHVFVLGDNRDMSADSRVSRVEMGVEQLPVADIRGAPRSILWSPDEGRAGTAFDG